MKNKFRYSLTAALFITLFCMSDIFAQRFEVIPFAGYQTGAKIQSYEGEFHISGGLTYGLNFALGSSGGPFKVYVSYSRQGSFLEIDTADNIHPVCDLAVHNVSFGGIYDFLVTDMVNPFTKFGCGTTIYQPLESDKNNERVMHFNLAGGVKLYFNEHFGVRFQAGMYLPLFFEGYLFEEGAPPPGEGVKTKIAGVHGDFTAGLIGRF